jgi:hypothetical protein
MNDILQKIAKIKSERLAAEKRLMPLEAVERKASAKASPLDFLGAFAKPGTHVIAEVKKASPSKGILKDDLDPAALVRAYEQGGASAVSVLTEEDHFSGSLKILEQARDQSRLPILRKDFIKDAYQVVQTRAAGADCGPPGCDPTEKPNRSGPLMANGAGGGSSRPATSSYGPGSRRQVDWHQQPRSKDIQREYRDQSSIDQEHSAGPYRHLRKWDQDS